MMSFTSRLALKDLISDVERHSNQHRLVYETIKNWPGIHGPSREDIARTTGIRLSSVCARVSELLKQEIIVKGPMKDQEVVPGHPLHVETLQALVFKPFQEEPKQMQLL